MITRRPLAARRVLLGTLGAALAATLAACSVPSDEGGPSPAPDATGAPGAPGATNGGATSNAGSDLAFGPRKEAVDRALRELARAQGLIMADARHALLARDVIVEPDGREHVRFDRTYRGVRVIGGDLVAHLGSDGTLTGVSQTLAEMIELDPAAASLDPAAASLAASRLVTGVAGAKATAGELVVYARESAAALGYEVVVSGQAADGTPSEMHVIVDASDGRELDSWDSIETASAPGGVGTSYFSGSVPLTTNSTATGFELKDPTRGNQYTTDLNGATNGTGAIFTDTNNLLWGNGSLSDRQTTGVDAQFGTAQTWDYYQNVHGRNGIGNDGKGAYNRVHYGSKYNNAFWTDSCFCMTYGDGDGTTFNPFDSLDVAGHEMSHGVTSRTAKLSYSRESGGLNEATSDIFGTAVEFYANRQEDAPDYDIGEKLYIAPGKALRYMYQPSKDGSSADCWYKRVGGLNVHYSSGVANHLFYLLAEGTAPAGFPASKTCNATDTIVATGTGVLAGIGRSKAEKVWYRALTTYMTSNTNYAGARLATVKAAADLAALEVLTPQDQAAVADAWTAVNVK